VASSPPFSHRPSFLALPTFLSLPPSSSLLVLAPRFSPGLASYSSLSLLDSSTGPDQMSRNPPFGESHLSLFPVPSNELTPDSSTTSESRLYTADPFANPCTHSLVSQLSPPLASFLQVRKFLSPSINLDFLLFTHLFYFSSFLFLVHLAPFPPCSRFPYPDMHPSQTLVLFATVLATVLAKSTGIALARLVSLSLSLAAAERADSLSPFRRDTEFRRRDGSINMQALDEERERLTAYVCSYSLVPYIVGDQLTRSLLSSNSKYATVSC